MFFRAASSVMREPAVYAPGGGLLLLIATSGMGMFPVAAMEDRPASMGKSTPSVPAAAIHSKGEPTAIPKLKLRRFLTQQVFEEKHPCAKPGDPDFNKEAAAEAKEAKEKLEAERIAAARATVAALSAGISSRQTTTGGSNSWANAIDILPPLLSSSDATCGHRQYMEDFCSVAANGRFAAVYDGHGGAQVAKFLKETFYQQFLRMLQRPRPQGPVAGGSDAEGGRQTKRVLEALWRAIASMEAGVVGERNWRQQGSTMTACVIVDEEDGVYAVTANVGDSRVVLSRSGRAVDLTQDHKPNSPKELERIRKLGGSVQWFGYCDNKGKPVDGTGVYRVNGNLAVSRAIGDAAEKPFVSPRPDLRVVKLNVGERVKGGGSSSSSSSSSHSDSSGSSISGMDDFIVLASDGLWDVMTSEEAVGYVHKMLAGKGARAKNVVEVNHAASNSWSSFLSPSMAMSAGSKEMIEGEPDVSELARRKNIMAKYLTDEAMRRGTSDNVTVLLIWLK